MLYPTELRADGCQTLTVGRGGEIRTPDILLPKQDYKLIKSSESCFLSQKIHYCRQVSTRLADRVWDKFCRGGISPETQQVWHKSDIGSEPQKFLLIGTVEPDISHVRKSKADFMLSVPSRAFVLGAKASAPCPSASSGRFPTSVPSINSCLAARQRPPD